MLEDITGNDVELFVPVEQVLGFLQLDEVGQREVFRHTESYVDDVLLAKSKYLLIRDTLLEKYRLEEKSPVMPYEDYLVKYSSRLRVFDEKVALLKDFVEMNLGYLTGVVVEPFTHKLWVTPKFYKVFEDYLEYIKDSVQTPYKVVAQRFGLDEVQVYTLSVKMSLMLGNADGMKTMTPLQYATLVAFLTNYKKVDDKDLINYLKGSKLPYYKVKGVGYFVENSLYKYLGDRGSEEVARNRTEIVHAGEIYYGEVDALSYLLNDCKLPRMSVLNAIHRGLLQGLVSKGNVLYKVVELRDLVGYYNHGYNLSLAIIFARGLIPEQVFKEEYMNKYQLRKLLVRLRDKGLVTSAFMSHYLNKPVESLSDLYGVPVYNREQVIHDLCLHRVLSPIGNVYSKGYYNILLVLQYLEANNVDVDSSWQLLGFTKEEGKWVYDNTVTSLGVMATPNICMISKDYLNDKAVEAIEKYKAGQEKEIREIVEELLREVSLLD